VLLLFLPPLLLLLFLSQTWVESPLYSSKRQTMATTRHLHRNLTAAKNIIPKPTHHGKKEATPNKGASQGASPNKNAEIWRGSSKSKLIYTDAPKGTQKTTASISESNQFRTKFFPPLFIFTTVGVIRIRRSRSFLSLFNPR
jgi:hypothetical protein